MLDIPVYSLATERLGDAWGSVNYLHRLSAQSQQIVLVSRYVRRQQLIDVSGLFQEIQSVLNAPGRLLMIDGLANIPVRPVEALRCAYYRTKTVWQANQSRLLCYQLDAVCHAARTPSANEVAEFIQRCVADGWRCEDLGHRRPLTESVQLAAQAEIFLGSLSGLTEVCASVGVPMMVVVDLPSERVLTALSGRRYTHFKTLAELIAKFP